MRLNWNPSLETGVRAIDLQHQELIDLINELDAAHAGAESETVLKEVLQRLTGYALFHFGMEEGLLGKAPVSAEYAEHHRNEHRKFAETVATMNASRPADSQSAVGDLIVYLQSWLVDHIMKTDKTLASAILSRKP